MPEPVPAAGAAPAVAAADTPAVADAPVLPMAPPQLAQPAPAAFVAVVPPTAQPVPPAPIAAPPIAAPPVAAPAPPLAYPSLPRYADPNASPWAAALGQPSPSTAPLASWLQALQTGQIPVVNPAPSGSARDATALLSLILSNSAFQDSLRRAAFERVPDTVNLAVPASMASRRRSVVPLPINDVIQAIAALAHRSTQELEESPHDEATATDATAEYLLTESGDFVVDPADSDRRVDLVTHYFRGAAEAARSGYFE